MTDLHGVRASASRSCTPRQGLPNIFGKLQRGAPVCIGFLGGSVTLAEGYRPKTVTYLQERYPQAAITHINAGMGGTGSILGACRLEEHILRHAPDMLFVDFSGNDCEHGTRQQCLAALEGIVRKTWTMDPTIDICFVHILNLTLRESLMAGELYWTVRNVEAIADHYGIPTINLGVEAVRLEQAGELVYRLEKDSQAEARASEEGKIIFSYDGTHPTLDQGHAVYARVIASSLEGMEGDAGCVKHVPAAPLSASPWTQARLVPFTEVALSEEWRQVTPDAEGLRCESIQRFTTLCRVDQPGATARFRFNGTGFGVFCIFGLNSGQLRVEVDDEEPFLVPFFDQYGSKHRVHYSLMRSDLEAGEHNVTLTLAQEAPDRSVLRQDRPAGDPSQYEGLVCYINSLLLIGEMCNP